MLSFSSFVARLTSTIFALAFIFHEILHVFNDIQITWEKTTNVLILIFRRICSTSLNFNAIEFRTIRTVCVGLNKADSCKYHLHDSIELNSF